MRGRAPKDGKSPGRPHQTNQAYATERRRRRKEKVMEKEKEEQEKEKAKEKKIIIIIILKSNHKLPFKKVVCKMCC